jgi:hypothetical protein
MSLQRHLSTTSKAIHNTQLPYIDALMKGKRGMHVVIKEGRRSERKREREKDLHCKSIISKEETKKKNDLRKQKEQR